MLPRIARTALLGLSLAAAVAWIGEAAPSASAGSAGKSQDPPHGGWDRPRASGVASVATTDGARDGAGPEMADGGIVCVGVLYTVQSGREAEAAEDLRRLAVFTRQEPGNLVYAVHRSLEDPRQFLIYEQYRSLADLEAHRKTPYFQRWSVEGLQKLAESRVGGTFTPF